MTASEQEIRGDERRKLLNELQEIIRPWQHTCLKWTPAGLHLLDAVVKFLIDRLKPGTNQSMLKHKEISDPNSCLNKAADDEPVFVLRASDKLAPQLIDAWSLQAAHHGCGEAKVEEARHAAQTMRDWGEKHGSKFPD